LVVKSSGTNTLTSLGYKFDYSQDPSETNSVVWPAGLEAQLVVSKGKAKLVVSRSDKSTFSITSFSARIVHSASNSIEVIGILGSNDLWQDPFVYRAGQTVTTFNTPELTGGDTYEITLSESFEINQISVAL
jgi:hypothetical protein